MCRNDNKAQLKRATERVVEADVNDGLDEYEERCQPDNGEFAPDDEWPTDAWISAVELPPGVSLS